MLESCTYIVCLPYWYELFIIFFNNTLLLNLFDHIKVFLLKKLSIKLKDDTLFNGLEFT